MRFSAVANIIGYILLIFSGAFLLPIFVGLYYQGLGAWLELVIIYGFPALCSLFFGGLGIFLTRDVKNIRDKEGFAAVGLGWLIIVLIGAMPYMIHATWFYDAGINEHHENPFNMDTGDNYETLEAFTNAYFESMSGFTTTGATVMEMPANETYHANGTITQAAPNSTYYPEEYSYALILWRSETQWMGGMGVIVLSVVFLSRILSGAILLLRAEGMVTEARIRPKIKDTFAILRWIYVTITGIQIVLLYIAGMSLYDATCHSMTVIASGGFSPMADSISGYPDPWVQGLLTVFMITAGINFLLYYHAVTGKPGKLFRDTEFRAYASIMTLGCLLIVVNLMTSAGMRWDQAMHQGVFNGVSIMSTTGYANADFDQWPAAARMILILFMFIGGSAGSTAGAVKVVRIVVLFKTFKREVIRLLNPKAVVHVRLGGENVPDQTIAGVTTFFFIYLMIAIISTLALLFFEADANMPIIDALSAVATSMGGVGPGLGVVGPTQTYLGLTIPTKLWLCGCMWFGRLEIYAALILFFPSTYRD